MTAYEIVTQVTVSAVPFDAVDFARFAVTVEWRGGDTYAVKWSGSMALGTDGTWDYEPLPSNRTDEWNAAHRFTYGTAIDLAAQAAEGFLARRGRT